MTAQYEKKMSQMRADMEDTFNSMSKHHQKLMAKNQVLEERLLRHVSLGEERQQEMDSQNSALITEVLHCITFVSGSF